MTAPVIVPVMAQQIELWPVERLRPYARNARTHSPEQVAQIAASIAEFGFVNPILVASDAGIVAGHGRLLAARKLGLVEVPVVVLDHLNEAQRRAYVLADNKLALNAGWDEALLAEELREIQALGLDLATVGFSASEVEALFAEPEEPETAAGEDEDIPEAPVEAVSKPGDIWLIGRHRLICGDCRDLAVVTQVLDPKQWAPSEWATASENLARRVNVCITSPPYASQRAYDPASGFKPIRPEEYTAWYSNVAANVAAVLADDGSYLLNIKEHADGGQRNLYVKKLIIAHVEQWGWRFVDELCWRKTDDGVPGGWGNRFKNAWEPVFHFARQEKIKFRPKAVGHWSDDCFDYSPNNPKSTSGSGLLGTGPRGAAADRGKNYESWQTTRRNANNLEGRHGGIARPSNVIECKTESSQGSHSAPFPRALVEFFIKAYSDPGDSIFDSFLGSGTTIAAAHVLDRVGCGSEISPAYCDVIVQRLMNLTAETAVLVGTNGITWAMHVGKTFEEIAERRGVPSHRALNPTVDPKPIAQENDGRHKANGAPVFVKSGRIR
jgi:DNA modification methylase